ncbi:MAG: glycosyltransferase, partial [Treponema sp.]|nr:glycosyltransferase [Treponema sp.]
MALFDVFRYGYGILFVGFHAVLLFGIFLEWIRDKRVLRAALAAEQRTGQAALVSVIIPIHNESRRMGGLLQSLAMQDYSGAEYIFIDDRSTDESPGLLAGFARGRKDCRIITLTENPGPNYKQFALGRGIEAAAGEFLLFTDGDCEVKPGWIRAMMRRMADDKTGAVIGPVFKKKTGKGFFPLYQCYDHAVRYNYLAAATGLGAAGGGFGNNLIIRRKALDAAGGYDAVPPSPTEDAALISQIRSCGRSSGEYRIHAVALDDADVQTCAESSWGNFISQTLRWNNGGLFSPDPVTRFNYNLLMLIIAVGILALPLLPFFPGLWPLPLAVLIGMIGNTIAVFSLFRRSLPGGGALYLLTLLCTPVYFTLMTIMGY